MRRQRGQKGLPSTGSLPPALNLQLTTVNVELPRAASIPAEYVADKNVRLGLYRRLAGIRTDQELNTLREEFKDRFGQPPEGVRSTLSSNSK